MFNPPQEKNQTTANRKGFGRQIHSTKAPSEQQQMPSILSQKEGAADEEYMDISVLQAQMPSSSPTNSNKLATVKTSHSYAADDQILSPYLENQFKTIWSVIKNNVDFRRYASMPKEEVSDDMRLVVQEVARLNELNVSDAETSAICKKIVDEMMGLGPIEPLLARDEVTEIMVNGPKTVYLEINGVIERSAITFRDNAHLVMVCQRIAAQVGRRVDESSPICDARLPDGSRVNIILSPLAVDGAALTIRKFQKEKLTLEKLVGFGSLDEVTAEIIRIMALCRINVLVSGGTGSGKTTMLNCLTRYISTGERIVTCEDAAELQLQQPHVVRLETRPSNLEGKGEVKMRDLVKNCLRMRPDRIIVGEVRGPEAFDLLQAMNTGHDGSMGTVHANTPRDALSRIENMIAMAQLNIPAEAVRKQIASSVNAVIQIQRLKDGTRKVMSISEITGMEGEIISMQELVSYHIDGEDQHGRIIGRFKTTGLKPRFSDKLRQFGLEQRFINLMGIHLKQVS